MISALSTASALLATALLGAIAALLILQVLRVLQDLWVSSQKPLWESRLMDWLFKVEAPETLIVSARYRWNRPIVFHVLYEMADRLEGAARTKCSELFERLGAVDQELKRLKSRWAFVRARAAYRLGNTGSGQAVVALTNALEDPEADVRFSVIQALGRLKAREAVLPILTHADRLKPYQLSAVVEVMKTLGLVDQPEARQYVVERLLYWPAVMKLGVLLTGKLQLIEGLPTLMQRFPRVAPDIRVEIAHAVGTLGDPRSSLALCRFLRDEHPEVRVALLRTIARLQNPEAVVWASAMASDPVWEVGEAAIRAVAQLDPTGEALARLLESDDNDLVRYKAAVALEELGTIKLWIQQMKSASGEELRKVRRRLRMAVKYEADQPVVREIWKDIAQN